MLCSLHMCLFIYLWNQSVVTSAQCAVYRHRWKNRINVLPLSQCSITKEVLTPHLYNSCGLKSGYSYSILKTDCLHFVCGERTEINTHKNCNVNKQKLPKIEYLHMIGIHRERWQRVIINRSLRNILNVDEYSSIGTSFRSVDCFERK